LANISDIKNILGIDTSIEPKISGFNMQKHVDQHKPWARALAIYGSFQLAFSLKTSNRRLDILKLSGTSILNVSAYIQKIPNVIGDDISELDTHLAHVPMRLTAMGFDHATKQASLILMSSFIGKFGHWTQQNNKALYSLTFLT